MNTNLRKYFPMIRTREDVLEIVLDNERLSSSFNKLKPEDKELFLDYCTGQRGIKTCYDPYFKNIFNTETDVERLNKLLSSIMGQQVKVVKVLPNDNTRIASEEVLLITDIVVQLENGSLVNLEIQKLGYYFPSQRASCYSADLLLREYTRIKTEKNKMFSYKDIMPIYTIVIYEKSPKEFKTLPDEYMHKSKVVFDTDLELDLLQNFIFISLDNFRSIIQNRVKSICGELDVSSILDIISEESGNVLLFETELEKWLTFLSFDEPEYIAALLMSDDYFKRLYEDIYNMCLNTERLMNMFSQELYELDKNTTKLMVDDMQETIDDLQKENAEDKKALAEKDEALAEQKAEIASLKAQLAALQS